MRSALRLCLIATAVMANLQDESLRYCESYNECVAVSRLEERLCIGNSRHRPYWLPSFLDPKKCYEKLKNDYKLLDHLELELEKQHTACLIEQTVPMTEEQSNGQRCSYHLIQNAPKFSFARTISYVPTNCFTGYEKRLEKECGRLKACCAATNRCHHVLSDSDAAKSLNSTRAEMWKRARGCERGEEIEPLQLALEIAAQNDDDQTWSPKGNITFRIRDQETIAREEAERKQSRERTNDDDKKHKDEMEKSADSKPTLTFPHEEKTNEARHPPSIEEHNRMFNEAMKNDNQLKEQLREAEHRGENTEKKVGNTIDSLLDASAAAAAARLFDGEPITPSPEDLQSLDEDVPTVSGKTATTGPVILVKPDNKLKAGCRQQTKKEEKKKEVKVNEKTSEMLDFDKVMKEMGEDTDEQSMKALREVLDNFKTDVRSKLAEAKAHTDDKKVIDVLEALIANFDKAAERLEQDKKAVNATFAPHDYPEDDAEIAGTICDPLAEEDVSLERDEHNDKIVLQDGGAKLVIDNGNLVLEGNAEHTDKDEQGVTPDEYKKELDEFKKAHHIDSTVVPERNETACDLYMRCRNQMHLALDGCAWRFAASRVLPTLAESAESLLYRGDDLCDPSDRPLYERLYDSVMERNGRLKKCLTRVNEQFFATSVCLPFPVEIGMEYNSALLRVLSANYTTSSECFHDANLIQEKCTKLRMCCPNFDRCRDDTLDIAEEQAIISQTAKVNERKQECLRVRAKEQFQLTLRELLGKAGPNVLHKIRNQGFLQPARA